MPCFWNPASWLLGTSAISDRLNAIRRGHSIRVFDDSIPLSLKRRTHSTASVPPTSIFFGSHPRSAQVPPNGRESTTATVQPAARQRDATADPAVPDPITTRSYRFVIAHPRVPLRLLQGGN